jgi:hypothetical protein
MLPPSQAASRLAAESKKSLQNVASPYAEETLCARCAV